MAKVKGSNIEINFYGFDEIAENLTKSKELLATAVEEAMKKSIEAPKADMLNFMEQHTKTEQHKKTGHTIESWTESIKNENNIVRVDIGFLATPANKYQGLPAIFLNHGGLRNDPYYFIDNAVNNNIDKIKEAQITAIREVFKKCGIS